MRMRQQNQINGIMHEHSAGQDPSGLQKKTVKGSIDSRVNDSLITWRETGYLGDKSSVRSSRSLHLEYTNNVILAWINLSHPGLAGTMPSSRIRTTSPTESFLEHSCHLWTLCKLARYSDDQHFQKCRRRPWQRCHRRSRGIDWYADAESGKASNGRPIRKWLGVSASTPSSSN